MKISSIFVAFLENMNFTTVCRKASVAEIQMIFWIQESMEG